MTISDAYNVLEINDENAQSLGYGDYRGLVVRCGDELITTAATLDDAAERLSVVVGGPVRLVPAVPISSGGRWVVTTV